KATSTAVPCPSATAPSPTTSPTAAPALGAVTPTVNAAALAHHGRLAFVSQGRLWVLDGDHAALRGLPTVTGRVPQDPSFSADGMWLSFLEATPIPDPEAGPRARCGWLAPMAAALTRSPLCPTSR